MSFFLFKSILGVFFMLFGLIALLTMLTLMGRSEKKSNPATLRKIHKIFGFLFFILLLVLSYFCIKYWMQLGDQISFRAVFHAFLAFGLIIVLMIKMLIVQFYKQLQKMAPALGIITFCLAFIVFSTSGGYYMIRSLCVHADVVNTATSTQTHTIGNSQNGEKLFSEKCGFCHYPDKGDFKSGPGLLNLTSKEKLLSSGLPPTLENIRKQLITPARIMPSFSTLSEQEIQDLLEYLKTL